MNSKLFIAFAALLLGGCVVERDASMYPLDASAKSTGVIEARMLGHGNLHGTVDATLPDGEVLKGSYSIVAGGSTSLDCEFLNNNVLGHGYGACRSDQGGMWRMIY